MLAVHRPMSSSEPSNNMPFGYNFDFTSQFPMPSPTAPAPGPSLLDDSETKYLESFFDGVSSNDPFNFDNMFSTGSTGTDLGSGWNDLPPQFMGTASSYGQQPLIGNHSLAGQPYGGMNSHFNTAPMIPSATPADVLEAATVLQNGAAGRSHSMAEPSMFGVPNMSIPQTNGTARSHSVSQYTQSRPSHNFPQRAAGEEFYHHGYYKDMVFGGDPEEGTRRRQGVRNNIEIQWGSDTRFSDPQGYSSSDHQRRIAEAERSKLSIMDRAFQLDMSNADSSAENTQPSSPVQTRTKVVQNNGGEDSSRSRKRRKNKHQDDDDDDDDEDDEEEEDEFTAAPPASKSAGKKRKPAKKNASSDPSNAESADINHKRRKSTAASVAASKAPRENLTENQKRENHIKSEQKRRSLIKEGFDDLHELVPGLRGGGFSKSAILIMTADWLESLIKGNEELRRRVDEMEGR